MAYTPPQLTPDNTQGNLAVVADEFGFARSDFRCNLIEWVLGCRRERGIALLGARKSHVQARHPFHFLGAWPVRSKARCLSFQEFGDLSVLYACQEHLAPRDKPTLFLAKCPIDNFGTLSLVTGNRKIKQAL